MLDAIDSDFQRFGNPSRESQSTQAGISKQYAFSSFLRQSKCSLNVLKWLWPFLGFQTSLF
jgi:hypothetical protein